MNAWYSRKMLLVSVGSRYFCSQFHSTNDWLGRTRRLIITVVYNSVNIHCRYSPKSCCEACKNSIVILFPPQKKQKNKQTKTANTVNRERWSESRWKVRYPAKVACVISFIRGPTLLRKERFISIFYIKRKELVFTDFLKELSNRLNSWGQKLQMPIYQMQRSPEKCDF